MFEVLKIDLDTATCTILSFKNTEVEASRMCARCNKAWLDTDSVYMWRFQGGKTLYTPFHAN